MNTLIAPLLSLSIAATAVAQESGSVLRLVPKDAVVVAQVDAPGKWSSTFAETRLGAFLAGPTVQDLIEPLRREFEAAMAEDSDAPAEVRELAKLVLESRGRFTIAFDLDVHADREPTLRALLAYRPADGEDDRLETVLTRLLEIVADETDAVVSDQPFGDLTLRTLERVGGPEPAFATMPLRIGEEIAMFMWNGERESIEQWARLDPGERMDPEANLEGSFAVRATLGPVITAFTDILAAEADGSFDVRQLFEQLGFLSLDRAELSITPEAEFVTMDVAVEWKGDGGVLEMLVPEQGSRPQLLDLAPRHIASWGVSTMRIPVFYDVIADIWDANADMVPMTREDAEASFAEHFKVRLREDLIDHLGGELLQAAPTQDGEFDVDDPMAGIAGQCFALQLKDAKAFGESFETMLRARGMHAARKTTDYRGFKLHQMRLAGFIQLDYVITDRVFAISINTKDPVALRAVLDEEAARRAGDEVAAFSEPVATRLEHVQDGWNGISVADMTLMFEGFRAAAAEDFSAGDMPPDLAQVLEASETLESALRDAELMRVVVTTWATPGRLRYRAVW